MTGDLTPEERAIVIRAARAIAQSLAGETRRRGWKGLRPKRSTVRDEKLLRSAADKLEATP